MSSCPVQHERGDVDAHEEGENRAVSVVPERCSGCLRCALACSFYTGGTKTFNPSKSRIQVRPALEVGRFDIRVTDECDGCGICVAYCAFGVLSKRREASLR